MYNYRKLKGLIREHCDTQEAYAKELGIALTTLQTRLNGTTYFRQTEIEKTAEMFNLGPLEVNEIFFVKN